MTLDVDTGDGMSGRTFEWHDDKRLSTIEKHGIDFVDAIRIFETRPLIVRSKHADEDRFIAVGPLEGVMIAVIYTIRGDAVRIVTARRARDNERKAYDAHDAG